MINPAAAGRPKGGPGRGAEDASGAEDDLDQQAEEFDRELRQTVDDALDVAAWTAGENMGELEERLEREVRAATIYEAGKAQGVLKIVRDNIKANPDASKESGVYDVSPEDIAHTLKTVLFNGLVEACDGARVTYDTLPISVIQIGICMTSYLDDGAPTSIGHRLFRHDMVRRNGNAEEEILAFMNQRVRASTPDENGEAGGISDMLVRAIMGHGERYLLTERSKKPWRMGHGTPMPYEMMTGSGSGRIIELTLGLLPKLLAGHKRFVFVPSETSDKAVRTIANALRPLQYAVLTDTRYIVDAFLRGSYRGKYARFKPKLCDFRDDVASKVLIGVYKASRFSPGNIFFGHEDHIHEAALIAMADSALQEHRGFPNLIDIADRLCKGTFDPSGIAAGVNSVFASQGEPFRYLIERATRG
jgi:hypothetical protein